MTDLDNARETWNFEREHWNGHGPSIRYDKATLALINALEDRLARAEGVIAKVEKATDENEDGWAWCGNCRERKGAMGYYLCSSHEGEWDMSAKVRAILSEANKEAT